MGCGFRNARHRPRMLTALAMLVMAALLFWVKFKPYQMWGYVTDSSRSWDPLQRPLSVLFHDNELYFRGTTVAVFDYGMFAQIVFGAEVYFTFERIKSQDTYNKFIAAFGADRLVIRDPSTDRSYARAMQSFMDEHQITHYYRMEYGDSEGFTPRGPINLVHAVFSCSRHHGDRYKAISPFVKENMGRWCTGAVPYMVWLPDYGRDRGNQLRNLLRIPAEALVFGWYGGFDAWDVAGTAIIADVARLRQDAFFLLQNFPPQELPAVAGIPNIIVLNATSSMYRKSSFLQAIDVFMHTREIGETFGLCVAEASILQRPIITSAVTPQRAHLDILGNRNYRYRDMREFRDLLMTLRPETLMRHPFRNHYKPFSPLAIMDVFNREFLDGKAVAREGVREKLGEANVLSFDLLKEFGFDSAFQPTENDLQLQL